MEPEDWDREISQPHPAPFAAFGKEVCRSSGGSGDPFNRAGSVDSLDVSVGFSRGDQFSRSGFDAGRCLGNRGNSGFGKSSPWELRTSDYGREDSSDEYSRRGNQPMTGGLGAGKGFGSRGSSGNKFEENDCFWKESLDQEDNQRGNPGFSRRGGFQEGDAESTRSSRRGGRGGFQDAPRGFGLTQSHESEPEDCMQGSGMLGVRKTGFADQPAGDFSRGRGFGRQGGYQGVNEEIIAGSEKSSWKPEAEAESGDSTTGPKVTYIPPPPPEDEASIFAHYQTGINFDKYDTILVEVSGHDVPPAIPTFEEANLCQTLINNIAKAGYSKLTPVQKYSIPIILAGRDLMACAQTGSGKTAAFLLPILAHMMREGVTASRFRDQQEPECIIVAPTRELINQIFLEARKFSFGTCVRPVVIYGGTQMGHSIRQIMQGCNLLCATPGRLMDIIGKEKIGLSHIKYLVLDEADRMLDMGFGPEMKKLISCPGMPSREHRQTLMFSATFPEEIQRLAGEFLKTEYLFVAVGQVGGACSDVQQSILQIGQYLKRENLIEILRNIGQERTMVFVETKKKADFIATFLCQENISATSIHGDREQREREQALGDFRSGKCPVLVATSVAARGLDIEKVQHVINFDLPSTIDEYVHRIGRTGRCGNIGRATSFFDPESDSHLAQPLVKVLSDANQDVPAWLEEIAFSNFVPGFNSTMKGSVFASVDSRKGPGKTNLNAEGFPPPHALNPVDNESWE
ncbi:probable ATP-dependent RNA helicase DDX4 [Tachyglossus aculeatus]|uniref:probable ATP-dependent RNA helicase DDX4 n=1 Tax=Tachyglossus aculeatus TaxID=9261 RepID=UPI0018F3F864|nr:probable ATP-dependent RNA helicase DDX4 [Tachyglossus aculeatus]